MVKTNSAKWVKTQESKYTLVMRNIQSKDTERKKKYSYTRQIITKRKLPKLHSYQMKIVFKATKSSIEDKEGPSILIKKSLVHQQNVRFLNLYAPNNIILRYIKHQKCIT